ncbi:MAG TPA: CPBP family intramembrane glutamic endopeptidase [Thermoanaerobaculia bacterium]|nr:CPBP family intramembrane glutamic endopeptidase [Thermoanaerobaculia bacterium]
MKRSLLSRADVVLLLAALAAGILFFASLDRLWPLPPIELTASPDVLVPKARAFLIERGFEVTEHAGASRLEVDDPILDYLVRSFGRDATQEWIREGRAVYYYLVSFKKENDPDSYWALLHPLAGVVGWGRTVQEDAPGARVDIGTARRAAFAAVEASVGWRLDELTEWGQTERERPARRDHFFVYEQYLSRTPELRERVSVTLTGGELTAVRRELVLPESGRREAREREAPVTALQMIGFLSIGLSAVGALVVFLTHLQTRKIRLRPAAGLVGVIALFFLTTQALRSADLLRQWDPLWPRWIATLQSLGISLAQGAWIALALFVVVAAGDALDREGGGGKGETLWLAVRGRFFDRRVGVASLRGFLIGLLCGGALTVTIVLLERVAAAGVAIQPQGFFFFALNSDLPALSTLLYFLMVALVEELGYRFFGGTWLFHLTRRRWAAILIPAILYGTAHTGLPFLPPYEPFWGRALAFTVVGCIWGWAYFRWDALTVVLSHFCADLFIFNWPRLGSGDPILVAKAIATIAVPLFPALFLLRVNRDGDA